MNSNPYLDPTRATPIFADVGPDTYAIDLAGVEVRTTYWRQAILPLHLYGQATDIARIMQFAERHDLRVIEDWVQAHLGSAAGRPVGSWGDARPFCFYPGKNLDGDARGIAINNTLSDSKVAQVVAAIRDFFARA